VLFKFYIQSVLKLKKYNSGAKRLNILYIEFLLQSVGTAYTVFCTLHCWPSQNPDDMFSIFFKFT